MGLLASIPFVGAHAQGADYQVEVIVFERNAPDATVVGGGGVSGPAATGAPPQELAPSRLLLAGAARALQRSGRYRLLIHSGWQQGTEDRPIRLTSESLSADGRAIIDGDVRLAVGRELRLQALVHCLYNGQGMMLRGDRRLRLGELHYFDHPIFGMLVQVTRVNAIAE